MTVLAGALTLGRAVLKKITADPEVNQILHDLPILRDLVKDLYDCHYDKFFVTLAMLEQITLLPSRLLARHTRLRTPPYTQLRESYCNPTLASLSTAFGVSEEFINSKRATQMDYC